MSQVRRFQEAVAEGRNDGSFDDRMRAVRAAVEKKFSGGLNGEWAYCQSIFDDHVIVEKGGKLYQVGYTVGTDGAVTLADDSQEVQVVYQPVKEGRDGFVLGPLTDDGRICEAGERPSGKTWSVVIVEEGMSKNRNRYKRAVLEAAAPKYDGALVYLDHQESQRRFGRSTKDVAGFLKDPKPMSLSESREAAAKFCLGARLVVTKESVRQEMVDAWMEGKAIFGLSHDIQGEAVTAVEADSGQPFYDITRIEQVDSVDLVTNPAAGGRLVRLVASNTVATSLEGDGRMLKKMIEAIKGSGRADLIAKLEALGAEPNEDQVLAIYQDALKPAPAPVKEAAAQPAVQPAAQPATTTTQPAATQLQEGMVAVPAAEFLEVRRDGLTSFTEAALAGANGLPDPVKDHLRKRIIVAIGGATLPTKDWITGQVKEQVDLFGLLSEQNIVVPAAGVTGANVRVTKDRRDKVQEALDDFFGVVKDDKAPGGFKVAEGDRNQMTSFRNLYVEITGDTNITGRIKEATRLTEALSTSSWGEILGDSITRRMVAEYRGAVELNNWRNTVAEVVPVNDFRTQRRMRFGGYGNLATVSQGAPYLAMTSPTDEEATYSPAKRGGTEMITIEMIANDDVGAIRRIPTRMARAAAQTLHEFVWDFLANNSAVYDGTALSHTSHANNVTAAMTPTQLSALRLKIKNQADMSSGKKLGLAARYLIVPNDLEEAAFQYTTSDRAVPDSSVASTAAAAAPNFIRKLNLQVITVDYWTDANNYWVTASIDQTPMIEVGFFGGREDPELFIQDQPNMGSLFSNDQIVYKIRHIYGGGVIDYRGFSGAIVA